MQAYQAARTLPLPFMQSLFQRSVFSLDGIRMLYHFGQFDAIHVRLPLSDVILCLCCFSLIL